jgi:hypothetical protein
MRHRRVHQRQPQGAEQQHGGELHPFGEGADHQRRGDDGEGQLEHGKHGFRDVAGQGVFFHAGHEDLAETADPVVAGPEREAVGVGEPQQRHQAGDGETLHQHGKHVLGSHQPP